MQQVVINNFVNACLTAVFLAVVVSVLYYSVKAIRAARGRPGRTDRETEFVTLEPQEARP
jgi:carbon starvation protein